VLLVGAGASAFLLGFCSEESFSTLLSVGAGDCAFAAGCSWTLVGTVSATLFVSAGAGAFAAGGCLVAVLEVFVVDESFLTALLVAAEDGPFAAGGSLVAAMLVGCFLDESSLTALFAGAGDDPFATGGSLVSVFEGTFLGESFLGSLVSVFAGAGDGPFAIGGCSSLVDAALVGSSVTVLRVGSGVVLGAGLEVGATTGVFVGSGVVVGAGVTCVVVGGAVVPPAHAGIFGTPM